MVVGVVGGVEVVVKVGAGRVAMAMAAGCVLCAATGGVERSVAHVFGGVRGGMVGGKECAMHVENGSVVRDVLGAW